MTIALPHPVLDPHSAAVAALTGFVPRWVSPFPFPCWHALCWQENDRGTAGLVWVTQDAPPVYAFASLTYDDLLGSRLGLTPADLAAVALEKLRLWHTNGIPRSFRRGVRVRRVTAEAVERSRT